MPFFGTVEDLTTFAGTTDPDIATTNYPQYAQTYGTLHTATVRTSGSPYNLRFIEAVQTGAGGSGNYGGPFSRSPISFKAWPTNGGRIFVGASFTSPHQPFHTGNSYMLEPGAELVMPASTLVDVFVANDGPFTGLSGFYDTTNYLSIAYTT
jgi:hypothetical protein